jgi:tetratricopeptide (TPR) repeat protein
MALERNENSADANENMGYMNLYHFKNYKEAVKYYDRSIKLRPEEPRVYIERARAYERQGSSFSARRDYKKALKLYEKMNKNEPSPCYNVYMAVCHLGLGKLALAKELFCGMIDTPSKPGAWCHRPECDSCLYGLGIIYEKEKNLKEALAYYERAAAISNSVKHNAALEAVKAQLK